ncbi:phosphotransferase family protein [Rhodococcus globerulus]|uniref:phosphotransferase family protein n=1 Tax=Rhodococcus globerulus TaxID=33008 RepID=UPI0005AA6A3F|nr:phosphotransferase [Rhodococcus globerulus]MCE4266305.1 phosphotransferase [Rhodococcus globerulus]
MTSAIVDPRVADDALASAIGEQISTAAGVTSCSATPCGAGQLADSYLVQLTYGRSPQPPGPTGVFLKLPPLESGSASTALRIDAFAREAYFYRALLPQLDVNTPQFLGHLELADGTTGLVLEDLSLVARPLDQLIDGTESQVASVFAQLAGLQAPYWNSVATAGGDQHFYNRTSDHIDGLAERYLRSWHRHGEAVSAGLSRRQRDLIVTFGESCVRWAATIEGPRTLAHQDLRLDNLLWSPSRGAFLIDWQTLAFTSPAWDTAFFLGTALPPEPRRSMQRDLLTRHVATLAERGVDDWPLDRAWTEHRRLTGSVLLAMIAAMAYVTPTPRGFEMFASLIDRGTQQALDLDLNEFLRK